MVFVRPWSWETCEYTRISTFIFFRSHFLAFTVTGKSIKPRNPNNAKGRRQRKRTPLLGFKRICICWIFKGISWAGVGRSLGTHPRTSLQHLLWKEGPVQHPLPAGGSYPGKYFTTVSRHHRFQAVFQLVTKTKDALYVSDCLCQDK